MKILKEFPPIIERARKVFPLTGKEIFAWGDIIYSPSSDDLPRCLIEHEYVHSLQQAGDPWSWWDRYLVDTKWRFEQELEAHIVEYRVFCEDNPLRNMRRVYLKSMAKRLSGPMYGRIVSFESAKRLIKNG